MIDDKEAVKKAFGKYAKHGSKLDRAVETVIAGGVKEHRFLPSGRTINTVVGRVGDEFIDVQKPYCSCSHFFFRVLNGKEALCYHLLSYKIASELARIDVVTFDDNEYGQVFPTIVGDVFSGLDRSSGSQSLRLD